MAAVSGHMRPWADNVTIEGNDEELERMWRTLELREKGMVKVEGLLEA